MPVVGISINQNAIGVLLRVIFLLLFSGQFPRSLCLAPEIELVDSLLVPYNLVIWFDEWNGLTRIHIT
jgi:hypothetical protein